MSDSFDRFADEPVCLTKEMFDDLINTIGKSPNPGIALRERLRKQEKNEMNVRAQSGIFLLTLRTFPFGLTITEIHRLINDEHLHLISDNRFDDLMKMELSRFLN